jgi:hypothetical protein
MGAESRKTGLPRLLVEMEQAAADAVREARWRNKQLGVPICVWEDGRMVIIPPEDIEVEPPAGGGQQAGES